MDHRAGDSRLRRTPRERLTTSNAPWSCRSASLFARPPPNKRLKLTGHRALQISVLPFGHETKRFQLPGHLGRQLSREPLGGSSVAHRPSRFPAVLRLGAIITNLTLYSWVLASVVLGSLEILNPRPQIREALATLATPSWIPALALSCFLLSLAGIAALLSRRPLGRFIALLVNACLVIIVAAPLLAHWSIIRNDSYFFYWLQIAIVAGLGTFGSALLLSRPVAHGLFRGNAAA